MTLGGPAQLNLYFKYQKINKWVFHKKSLFPKLAKHFKDFWSYVEGLEIDIYKLLMILFITKFQSLFSSSGLQCFITL